MMFPGGGYPGGGFGVREEFKETFKCNSMSFFNKEDKEGGDKIILPSSAFEKLARMSIQYPMQFKIWNNATPVDLTDPNASGQHTHVGVLEFTAPEGKCFVPYWIMENLLVPEGGFLTVEIVGLNKASFVKFRPQTEDFLEISNPKAVLESTLRNFSCVTKNDQLCLPYNNRKYYLDVVEVRPDDACSIVEADVNVEFAPPPGYEEKLKANKAKAEAEAHALAEAALAQAQGSANGAPVPGTPPPVPGSSKEQSLGSGELGASSNAALQELAKAREARIKQLKAQEAGYVAFSGSGRRIDGKKKGDESNPTKDEALTAVAAAVRTSRKGKWKSKNQGNSFSGQGNSLN